MKKDVLMILPRKTIREEFSLPSGVRDRIEDKIIILENDKGILAKGCLSQRDDFGIDRQAAVFAIYEENLDGGDLLVKQQLIQCILSRLALSYEEIAGKYPLYIRLNSHDLFEIAACSRMGFIPYFGKWEESLPRQGEKTWERITKALRENPEKLAT